jgi:hypothetical protein
MWGDPLCIHAGTSWVVFQATCFGEPRSDFRLHVLQANHVVTDTRRIDSMACTRHKQGLSNSAVRVFFLDKRPGEIECGLTFGFHPVATFVVRHVHPVTSWTNGSFFRGVANVIVDQTPTNEMNGDLSRENRERSMWANTGLPVLALLRFRSLSTSTSFVGTPSGLAS